MSGGVETEAGVLSIGLLGPLRVSRFGEQLPLGGRQQKAILAILLVDADRAVSLDRLDGVDSGVCEVVAVCLRLRPEWRVRSTKTGWVAVSREVR